MGCFSVFPCFTSTKHPKLNESVNPTTSSSSANQGYVKNCEIVLITAPTEESTNIGSLKTPISKSRVNSEDQAINDSDSKTVAIDLDAEISTEVLSMKSEDDKEKNVKEGSGKLGVLVQLESAKERDDEKKNETGQLGVLVQIETENERKEAKQNNIGVHVEIENESEGESDGEKEARTEEHEKEIQSGAISDSSVSSYISYPPIHRYHNCVTVEDEEHLLIEEDSTESLFSLSIDPTRQSKSSPAQVDDKEVSSPLKTSSSPKLIAKSISSCPVENNYNHNHDKSVDSLLNPIENLAQWKTMKARPMPGLDHLQEKENLYSEQEEISKVSDQKGKLKNDTVVATSLSRWLVDPEKSTTVSKEESQFSGGSDGATSWKSFEDRPILGAWNIDEVKQISARSSPRKSPCHNPDMPIIGTVGSYWSHTGQATDSSNSCTSPLGMSAKSRKNKALSCHSSSKRRLEKAFDKSAD